ncbi:MAG: VCBS repeat-containing protein [Saprospiraceae bacterium]|nr:VCBS repeat-containing protein [Saprospiraceae bacterium]MCB9326976.1 VCBS repeat-containing protein [Lewinellaceae bacterium]
MTNFLQKLPLLLGLILALPGVAQVTFTNQTALLNPVIGASLEDCTVDMNNDNLDDIVRITTGHIYIDYQQLDGTFTQKDFAMNLTVYPTWSMCAGDLNEDGFNDLLLGSGSAVSFVYSNEDGTAYSEVAHPEYIFSQRSTMADIDNDGHLDAFVCHDVDLSHPYRNDGTGNMVLDQTLIVTADLAGNYAALWVDYDNDNDIDLYITKCRGGAAPGAIERTNLLYRNNGDGTFSEVGEEANMNDNAQSWTTVFEDFDNDGDFDAFIVNHDFQNRFMRNNGDGTFTDIIQTTGINPNDLGAWENAGADFDNNGYVDILSELDFQLHLNNGDLTFTPTNIPFPNGGIGDFNNDGFMDVIRGNDLWINDGNENNWVKICPQGFLSNKNGIGARVEIYGEWGRQIREIRSTQSFSTMNTLAANFGIGTATAIDSIVVRWPSGMRTKLDAPAINTTHIIPEAECLLAEETITAAGPTAICPGASVVLQGPDGFASYTWSNGATSQNLTATTPGSYNLIAKDEGECVALSNSITVTYMDDPNPVISINGEEQFCQGESVELVASSDQNPVWSNGMSGQSVNITTSGFYTVFTESVCSEEQLPSESVEIIVLPAEAPEITSVEFDNMLESQATITVTGDSLNWYNQEMGGEIIGSGNTFITPPIVEEETTYFVESVNVFGGALQDGGKPDIEGTGGLPSSGAYSYFNVWEPFTLLTVDVVVPENAPEGPRTIQLVDGAGNILEQTSVDLTAGLQVLELNWEIPIGDMMTLRCPENNLFRNNGGVNYPYPIGDVGSILTSFFGDSYYYYFYNWKIKKLEEFCVSERTPVTLYINNLDELPGIADIRLFPNPVDEQLFISYTALEDKMISFRLFNSIGQEVSNISNLITSAGANTQKIEVKHLPAGLYTLQFQVDGKIATGKVVVE